MSSAWGTSMITNATLSAPSLSATEIGSPKNVLSGLAIANVDSSSVIRPPPNAWNSITGTPASCRASHSDSVTPDWLRVTATTSSSTIWLAQSVAPAGSPPVSQVTTSIGRPPTPPWWSFQYSAVASAARSSSELSNAWVAPSDTIPTFTGSPLAGCSGPRSSSTSAPWGSSGSAPVPSSPPHPIAATSNAPSVAAAIARLRHPRTGRDALVESNMAPPPKAPPAGGNLVDRLVHDKPID